MVVSISVAMTMAKIVGAKMATPKDVAVGRLGCDIARVVVRRYLGEKLARYELLQGQTVVG